MTTDAFTWYRTGCWGE